MLQFAKRRKSHMLVKCFNEKAQALFYYVGRPEAYKHAMRMIAAHFSPQTGKGQRAQSMDSDHSGSLPFVKRYLRATQVILEVKLATQGVQRVRRAAVMLSRNCFCSFQTALTALRSTSYSSTDRKQQQLFFPLPAMHLSIKPST